jgi:predicted AAA+ superfamily ATPase
VFLLPAWHTNLSKRLYSTPKVHFLDTGLCAYLTEWSSPETLSAGAMSGAILESYAVSEILKSWWHRGKDPALYHYRDKDGREIDLIIAYDGRLHPIEVKRAATVSSDNVAAFRLLEHLGAKAGHGAVLSLSSQSIPLSHSAVSLPIGWL